VRTRNVKPAFFLNEHLAELSPHARLLFIGLWCMADCEGRLEDRPKRIKAALFPFEDFDADGCLEELAMCNDAFVTRYEVGGQRYIQINNFEKHQKPSTKEKLSGSVIPPRDVTGTYLAHSGSDPVTSQIGASSALYPIPSTLLLPEKNKKFSDEDRAMAVWMFEEKIKPLYPKQKPPNYDQWAEVIRKLREIDERTLPEIKALFEWANNDTFWRTNILSPETLRKQWDKLAIKQSQQGQSLGHANGERGLVL